MIIAPPTLLLLLLPPFFFYIRTVLYTFPVVGYERERPFLSCVCIFFFSLALFLSAGASRGRILGRPVDCFRLIGPDSLSTLPSMFFLFFFSLSRRRRAHTEPSDQWTVHATSNRLNYIHDVLLTAGLAGAVPVTSAGL